MPFMDAVSKSYEHYDDKLVMLQRAMEISSEELHDANRVLEAETQQQKKILESLETAVKALQPNSPQDQMAPTAQSGDFDAAGLAGKIEDLAKQVAQTNREKDRLLHHLKLRNESLNNYAHAVSHDLKSPIRNISALVSWIGDDDSDHLSEGSKGHINLVLQNLEKMDRLINGILQHATLERGNGSPVLFELEDLIVDILNKISVPDHITVQWSQLPSLCHDRKHLEQLFTNLLTNAVAAVKGKEKGLVSLSCEDQGSHYYFKVSDNGKGIPKAHHQDIFEMFNKLETEGTGIGLALVKKTVELYQGKIWLESEENKGTTVHFTIQKQQQ